MRRLAPFAAFLLALTLATAYAKADEKDPDADLGKFQGRWNTKVGPDQLKMVLIFKDKAVTYTVTNAQGGEIVVKGEIRLDATAKPHKTIDWVEFTSPQGVKLPTKPGIYVFDDGDTLRICNPGRDNVRPDKYYEGHEFDGDAATYLLKREKAEGKDQAP